VEAVCYAQVASAEKASKITFSFSSRRVVLLDEKEFAKMITESSLRQLLSDIETAVKDGKRWCCICRHAVKITIAPSPSGPFDGVECDSVDVITRVMSEEGLEVFDEKTINLFRGEVCSEDFECAFFEWKLCDECSRDKANRFCVKCEKRLCQKCYGKHEAHSH